MGIPNVERLANGSQARRSQPLSVRGLPNPVWLFVVRWGSSPDADVRMAIAARAACKCR